MKWNIVCLVACMLAVCIGFTACAETGNDWRDSCPSYFSCSRGSIQYEAPVTIHQQNNYTLHRWSASLASMLTIEPSLFSAQKVRNEEHRVFNDYEYETYDNYYILDDESTLLVSSNGRCTFSTPRGSALNQLFNMYSDQLLPCTLQATEVELVTRTMSDISGCVNNFPKYRIRLAFTLTHDDALKYAKMYDEAYSAAFSQKKSSVLENVMENCGDITYVRLQYEYDGLGMGDYYYEIHSSERVIYLNDAMLILCGSEVVYVSMPRVYITDEQLSDVTNAYSFEDAVSHFEAKMNEGLLLDDWLVYAIDFETGVYATGSGQGDFEIVPVWHFYAISEKAISEVEPEYIDAVYESATHHYVFDAQNGNWISW